MKKIISIILMLIMVISVLTACEKKEETNDANEYLGGSENTSEQADNEVQNTEQTDNEVQSTEKNDVETYTNENGSAFTVNTDVSGEIISGNPIDSNKIDLNGVEFNLPCPVTDLLDNGFSFRGNTVNNKTYDAKATASFIGCDLKYNEMNTCYYLLSIYNGADSVKKIEECELQSITINCNEKSDSRLCDFVLPGGITENSTAADVLNVYGNPYDSTYFKSGSMSNRGLYYYNNDSSVSYEFIFHDDGTLIRIKISY